jgi:hypothetical protein
MEKQEMKKTPQKRIRKFTSEKKKNKQTQI